MRIRVHITNRLEAGTERHGQDGTFMLEVSFFLWLKSLFFGLDLCLTSLMFPKMETDEDTGKDARGNDEKKNIDMSVKKQREKKQKTVSRPSDFDLYGIQWDDDTVVYPDGHSVPCDVRRTSLSTCDACDEAPSVSDDSSDVSVGNSSREHAVAQGGEPIVLRDMDRTVPGEEETNAQENVQGHEIGHADENGIDYANPPHSNRWKSRNLPPRKPFVPRY